MSRSNVNATTSQADRVSACHRQKQKSNSIVNAVTSHRITNYDSTYRKKEVMMNQRTADARTSSADVDEGVEEDGPQEAQEDLCGAVQAADRD